MYDKYTYIIMFLYNVLVILDLQHLYVYIIKKMIINHRRCRACTINRELQISSPEALPIKWRTLSRCIKTINWVLQRTDTDTEDHVCACETLTAKV